MKTITRNQRDQLFRMSGYADHALNYLRDLEDVAILITGDKEGSFTLDYLNGTISQQELFKSLDIKVE